MKKPITCLIVLVVFCLSSFGQNSTTLTGHLVGLTRDSVKCVLMINNVTSQTQTIRIPVVNGKFHQQISIIKPTYLYLTDGENYFNGLMEPGDAIFLKFDTSNTQNPLMIQGKGKEKFQFLNSLASEKFYKKLLTQVPVARSKKFPFDHMLHYVDSAENSFTHRLDSVKKWMSPESYLLLLADIRGYFLSNRNNSITYIYHETVLKTLQTRQKELTHKSKLELQNLQKFNNNFSYSSSYIREVFGIIYRDYGSLMIDNAVSNNLVAKYHYIDSLLPVDLKVPVLTLFLEKDINELNAGEDIEKLIGQIFRLPKDSAYKNYITNVYRDAIAVTNFRKGMPAPDFSLQNTKGEKVNLSSFKGKVVYIDFWFAACGPCHALFKMVEPAKEHFSSNKEVVFLYVSIDQEDIWKKSLLQYDLKGYHVFTENKEGNHPIIKDYKVKGYPTTCLIDRNGNIFNARPSNISEDLQKQIEEALRVE